MSRVAKRSEPSSSLILTNGQLSSPITNKKLPSLNPLIYRREHYNNTFATRLLTVTVIFFKALKVDCFSSKSRVRLIWKNRGVSDIIRYIQAPFVLYNNIR